MIPARMKKKLKVSVGSVRTTQIGFLTKQAMLEKLNQEDPSMLSGRRDDTGRVKKHME